VVQSLPLLPFTIYAANHTIAGFRYVSRLCILPIDFLLTISQAWPVTLHLSAARRMQMILLCSFGLISVLTIQWHHSQRMTSWATPIAPHGHHPTSCVAYQPLGTLTISGQDTSGLLSTKSQATYDAWLLGLICTFHSTPTD